MATASIGSYQFDIDPSSAQWTYTLRTRSYQTYGGRVVQILGCSIDDLSIGGYLLQPKGGDANRYNNMQTFESNITAIMEAQAESKTSVTFTYPVLDWVGQVFLVGYDSVKYDVATAAISYKLSFQVDSGFGAIKTAVSSEGLDLIPDGVNWTRNVYNTPDVSWDDVKTALTKVLESAGTSSTTASLYDYLEQVEAIEEAESTTSSDTSSSDSSSTSSSSLSDTLSSTGTFFSEHYSSTLSTDTGGF